MVHLEDQCEAILREYIDSFRVESTGHGLPARLVMRLRTYADLQLLVYVPKNREMIFFTASLDSASLASSPLRLVQFTFRKHLKNL